MSQMARLSAYMVEQKDCTFDCVNLDCIYDDEPLGLEYSSFVSNDLCSRNKKIEVQDPLEKVDIGERGDRRPTYISNLLLQDYKEKLVEMLKEFEDCFTWEYDEMSSLSRELMEHRLPLKPQI